MSVKTGLRVVVTGATGNVGTSVMRALAGDSRIASVLGLARRVPDLDISRTSWAAVDLAREDAGERLVRHLEGADAVVHLAWRFQPTHSPATTWQTNVLGSLRLFDAVAAAQVPALVHASSVGAYTPGPKTGPGVDESWPTHGWPEAAYCREKSYLERALDAFELRQSSTRVVRMRPAFMFKETSASEQRRIFAGKFLPGPLIRPGLLPFVPDIEGLRFQALHTDDAAQAYLSAVLLDARGAFNLAAEPVVDARTLGDLLKAKVVRVPRQAAHAVVSAAWGLRAVPASPQLFDALLRMPVMSTARAREELDWEPRHSAKAALEEFLRGVRKGSGERTAPLVGHRAH